MRALSLPGCACRGAFQTNVLSKLIAQGERFDLVAGASSGSITGAAYVAGLVHEAPDMWRAMAQTPVVSGRYLRSERSPFGMSVILRNALKRFLPQDKLHNTEAELLVATTRARPFISGKKDALVIHSNRQRRDMHEVIIASCYIPIIYAKTARLDGEVHLDGGAADNTLLDALADRGATEITVITPFPEGRIARTLFSPEERPKRPNNAPHVRLRLLFPKQQLKLKNFDFTKAPLEEALTTAFSEVFV